jgi:hypothetical protein
MAKSKKQSIPFKTEPLCILCGKIVDKEMAKITKPKPFVYLNELKRISRKKVAEHSTIDNYGLGICDVLVAAAKIARERGRND